MNGFLFSRRQGANLGKVLFFNNTAKLIRSYLVTKIEDCVTLNYDRHKLFRCYL